MTTSRNGQPTGLILYVNNDKEASGMRQTFLRNHGYEVVTAENALEALELMTQRPVHITLLNYHTELTSETLAVVLKERYPRTPIILDSCPSEVPEALLWLVDDYVLKATPLAVLLQALGKWTKPKPTLEMGSGASAA